MQRFSGDFRQFQAIRGHTEPGKKPVLINKKKAEDCTPRKGRFPKGWFCLLADVPPERNRNEGTFRCSPGTKNRNEGTFGCSPGTKDRNEGTFGCSPGTKTGTSVRSPKPPFYETTLSSPSEIGRAKMPPYKGSHPMSPLEV